MSDSSTQDGAGSRSVLCGLRALLRYHSHIGIEGYPGRGVGDALFKWREDAARQLAAPPARPTRATAPGVGGKRGEEARATVSLDDIAEEVRGCRACGLHLQRLYPVPGRGPAKMRLLLVGDWLMAAEGDGLPPGLVFGVEQEAMLARMFAAIGLPAEEVFVTNVVKCALPTGFTPQEEHIERCRSYLLRQIAAASPQAVCTMGPVAARAVLGPATTLLRARGRVHTMQEHGGKPVTVIATYHPTFLLQNAEMKQATWADLQLLARELGLR